MLSLGQVNIESQQLMIFKNKIQSTSEPSINDKKELHLFLDSKYKMIMQCLYFKIILDQSELI